MKLCQSRYNSQCKLSLQYLLDISEEITRSYAPHESHHQPELVLMPVDPVNLYAYWNLNDSDSNSDNIINNTSKPLALRIYSLPELSESASDIKLSFDIKVQGFQNQQKVHLPIAASAYSAVIGEINADNSFSTLATAETIHVPRDSPVTENSPDDDADTIVTGQIQDNNLITHHTHTPLLDSNPDFTLQDSAVMMHTGQMQESNLPLTQTPSVSPATENKPVTESNTNQAWYERLVLANFNDFGYDLKVYGNIPDAESKISLSGQVLNIHIVPKTENTMTKNSSGLGR